MTGSGVVGWKLINLLLSLILIAAGLIGAVAGRYWSVGYSLYLVGEDIKRLVGSGRLPEGKSIVGSQ